MDGEKGRWREKGDESGDGITISYEKERRRKKGVDVETEGEGGWKGEMITVTASCCHILGWNLTLTRGHR